MAKIANKQVICDVLVEEGKKDKDIVVLCSDSRDRYRGAGSGRDLRRPGQVRQEALRGFSGVLPFHPQL